MQKKDTIVRYLAEEWAAMRARGESQTDWSRIDAMPAEAWKEAVASDPDSAIPPEDWTEIIRGVPSARVGPHRQRGQGAGAAVPEAHHIPCPYETPRLVVLSPRFRQQIAPATSWPTDSQTLHWFLDVQH